MIEVLKKYFLGLGKKLTWALFGLFILGALLIPQPAFAIWDWVVGAITFLPSLAVNLVFQVVILIMGSLAALAGTILHWVLSPEFISWSYTNPANNPVIEIGLNITRGFVNIGLVLALVYIAFSTILRIAGYKTQKLLVTLVLVALLVNFAPVICGLIVDASNIVMHYFTQHVTGLKNFTNALGAIGDNLKATFTNKESVKITGQAMLLAHSLVLIFFNLGLFFVLLAFAFIFILRYVVIWILVILSPLAFVSYILPATKKMFFDMWWKQLIQWSIIGIIAGFFIYLGEQTVEALSASNLMFAVESDEYGVLNAVLPQVVSLAFLVIGFFLSLTTSAMGASQIMNLSQKAGMATGKWGSKTGWGKAKPWLKENLIPERVRRAGERMATYAPSGRFARVAGAPIWSISRAVGRTVGPDLIESERKEIDGAEKKVADKRLTAQASAFRDATSDQTRIGTLNAMVKDKNIDDAIQQGFVTENEINRLYPIAQNRYDKHSILRSAFPRIAAANLPPGTTPQPGVTPLQHILERIKATDYENVSRGTLDNDEFIDAVLERGTGGQVSRLNEAHQQAAAQRLEERLRALTAGSLGTPPTQVTNAQMIQYLSNRNRRLHQYFTRGAGRGLIGI